MSGVPTEGRGLAGAFERSWSGLPGAVPWTVALAPLALAYAAGAGMARARARASRSRLEGVPVLCVGGLTVGGSGKTSLVRWLAEAMGERGARPAVVSRGYRRDAVPGDAWVLPDAGDYPMARLTRLAGDEAASLRRALPGTAVVAVGRDRRSAAVRAVSGYGADLVLLDDGWEQGSLAWDRLWVAVDPARPFGNGWPLPSGPLRRSAGTLREADAVAFVLEPGDGVSEMALDRVRARAPRARILRFRRTLERVTPVGDRGSGTGDDLRGARVALVTAVGAPSRVERLVEASGGSVVVHAAFPDHAAFGERELSAALDRAARAGAARALITEKDEPRWPRGLATPIPVGVLRARLTPLDPVEPLLAELAPGGGAASHAVPLAAPLGSRSA